MLAAIKVVATCSLIVGVGIAHGEVLKQDSRAAKKAPAIVVAPSGSDSRCRRGYRSRPCASLSKAYSLARCGDAIEVAAGSYGDQHVIETTAGSTCNGNPILFHAASRTKPTISWISFGRWSGGARFDAADNLTLRGFRVTRGLSMWGDVVNVTLDDIDGGSFFIAGGTNIRVINSDWGPCGAEAIIGDCRNYYPGDGRSGQVRIISGTNLLFENNVFHDMIMEPPFTNHFECIFMNAGGLTNVTFRGNRFYNCQTNAIALGNGGSPANVAGTWLFENNWFGSCPGGTAGGNGPYCLNFTHTPFDAKVIVRFNSFAPGEYFGCESACNTEGGRGTITAIGNIFGSGAVCVRGGTYRDNLFLNPGSGCGEPARFSVFGYTYNGRRLVREPRAAEAVRTAFAEVGARKKRSLSRIARRLSRHRKAAPPGGWRAVSVRAIVSDSVYLGRRLGVQSQHQRLVTPSQWRKAQRALASARG
jgi:Recombinase/Protein of unknown function (DUF1565)